MLLFFSFVCQQAGFSSDQVNDDVDINEVSVLRPGESIEEKIRKNFFLRAEINKTTCYVGEPLMVVYKVYSRLNTISQVIKRPSLTGFSVLEMVDSYEDRPELEVLNGVPYYVSLIRKVHLFPLQEGEFTLDPAEIESVIHLVKINEGSAPIRVDHQLTLRSLPVAVTVKALPADKQPEHFSGAVGNFAVNVLPPSTPIHPGELVKIRVVITGSGNISLLTPPVVDWPVGVDTADPSVKESVNKYVYPLTGSKIFEYSFAAPDTGHFTIPVVELPFYDPVHQVYKIASSQAVTLAVTPGLSKEAVQARTTALAEENGSAVPRQLYWFGLVVVLIAGWVIYQSVQLRRSKKKATLVPVANMPVEPIVQQPTPAELLIAAQAAWQQGNKRLFFLEIQQALWNLAAAKCAVAPSSLNKQNIAVRLADQGVAQPVIHNFYAVLNDCEWALYVPAAELNDGELLLKKAEQVLQDLQTI